MAKSGSSGFAATPATSAGLTPSVLLHAKVLVASYGREHAFEIVHANSASEDEPYWDEVLYAMRRLDDGDRARE